ncbi:MAG: N-acetylmuramoyl-L-alanine amidase [Actinomycetota bacterium]|nr:N-acetylmuramoyl-L-alanine amidase [Actinomycetota bacterium]
MCEAPPPIDLRLTRRRFLVAAPVGMAAAAILRPPAAVAVAADLPITPRSSWGGDLLPTRPIPDEPDVRVLLVHHSVNSNSYAQSAVPGMLRSIYSFHTGDKGWPDVAYNFFVDRFGGVWEGRTGSLAGPKAGDATGGNQGYSQLCCFLGDHSAAAPSEAAQEAMGRLLGWLAGRHGVDLSDGARARFTSRGSNKFAAGAAIDVPTVAGHRDVTQTACPGNAAYALVTDGTFRRLAGGGGAASPPGTSAPTTTTTTTAKPTTAAKSAPTTTTTSVPATSPSSSSSSSSSPSTTARRRSTTTELAAPVRATDDSGGSNAPTIAAVGATAAAAAGAAALAVRARSSRRA